MRGFVHHMRNNLQVIRGEVDLLHLRGTIPQQSFENIDRSVDQLQNLLDAITALPETGPFSLVARVGTNRTTAEAQAKK